MRAQPLALVEAVDLQHQAVDLEIQLVQPLDQLLAVLDGRVERRRSRLDLGRDRQAEALHFVEKLHVRAGRQPLGRGPPNGRRTAAAAAAQIRGSSWRTLPAVTLRVLANSGLPSAFCCLVQPHQVGIGHVDFAADLQQRRHLPAVQSQGDVANRADVVGDVVADAAVAAGDAPDQQSLFIDQRDGHAVDLQFDHPLDRLAVEQLGRPLAVTLQFLDAVGIVDREHRHPMGDLPQPFDGLVADALRGAVRRDQLGMRRPPTALSRSINRSYWRSLISGAAST